MFLAKWKALLVRNPLSMGYRFDSWYCQFICFKWGSVVLDRFKPAEEIKPVLNHLIIIE